MSFRQAVEATPEVARAWCAGLQALAPADRGRMEAIRPRLLEGSVNLDETLRAHRPQAERWDYGIAVRDADADKVYWVEVHPANEGSVREIESKLAWLKAWLGTSAPSLDRLPRDFVWVASGASSFNQRAPALRRLAQQGLRYAGRSLRLC